MNREIAKILSENLQQSTKDLNNCVREMRNSMPNDELKIYMEKISHIMALNFDILDLIGSEYPEYNPYGESNKNL